MIFVLFDVLRRLVIFRVMKILILYILFSLVYSNLWASGLTSPEIQNILITENPRLKAMVYEIEMLKKRALSTKSLEDPKLKIALNNIPTNDFSLRNEDMTTKEIGISQMFPLGGKLKTKEEVAIKEYHRALERLRKERVEMLHMLRMSLYETYYVRESYKILEDLKEYISLLIDIETVGSKTGMGSLTNVIKANVEKTMIDEEIISLNQKERELVNNIYYLVGREVDIAFQNFSSVYFNEINAENVLNDILNNNPDIKILNIEKEISEGEVELRVREYYPDMELSFSYMQRDSSPMGMKRPDMISAMVIFNIPLWYKGKNIPMITEMQRKKSMVDALLNDKRNELKSKAESILSQLKKWKELYKLYKEELIPQNELLLETIVSRYKSGSGDFMPAIDTLRILLKYKRELVMINKEYLSAISQLNSLMGVEILR